MISCAVLLALSTVPPGLAGDTGSAAPRLDIVLERNSFLPNDRVPVEVWLENFSEQPLEEVRLQFAGPDFLQLAPRDCKGRLTAGAIHFGRLAPRSVVRCRLVLQAASAVEEQDLTLVFGLHYRERTEQGVLESYVLRQEKVRASLFGTRSVAGVDLSTLAYLLPGLIVLILLRSLEVPVIGKLSNNETAVVTVAFSITMITLASGAGFGRLMSPLRLLGICLASIVLAAIFASPAILEKVEAHRRAKLVLPPDPPIPLALERAYLQKDSWRLFPRLRNRGQQPLGPVRVALRSGEELWGSIAGTSEKGPVLLGWFKVDPGNDDGLRRRLEEGVRRADLGEVLAAARRLRLEPTNTIYVKDKEGDLRTTGDRIRQLLAAEVYDLSISRDADLPEELTDPPVRVVKESTLRKENTSDSKLAEVFV